MNAALTNRSAWEGSCITAKQQELNLKDIAIGKRVELGVEQAKPPAAQNAQLIAQLQADIQALDANIAAWAQTFQDSYDQYSAAQQTATEKYQAANVLYNRLVAAGVSVNPPSTVPTLKTQDDLTTIANNTRR